jgi:dTDP-4-amino-4,6-dideoxygalactose transaminase
VSCDSIQAESLFTGCWKTNNLNKDASSRKPGEMKERVTDLARSIYQMSNSRLISHLTESYIKRRKATWITFRWYDRQHESIAQEIHKEMDILLGFRTDFESESYVRQFEGKFSRMIGCRYAIGTHSGTAALQLSLVALGIKPGDEVITVPNTYVATALAILNTGANPVFVDIEKDFFTMDPAKLEAAINDRTKAIVPVHLYGQTADMDPIRRVARRHGLAVIEDACQAAGATYKGRPAGSLGDVGCFSFFTGKNLGGFGNGGMAVCNHRKTARAIHLLRDPESDDVQILKSRRTPCYLDAVQAAFLNVKMGRLQEWTRIRREKARLYTELLERSPVQTPIEAKGNHHSYYSYVIQATHRDQLQRHLARNRIESIVEYNPLLHQARTFRDLPHRPGGFPVAEGADKRILSLPISRFLQDEEIRRVCSTIREFYRKR